MLDDGGFTSAVSKWRQRTTTHSDPTAPAESAPRSMWSDVQAQIQESQRPTGYAELLTGYKAKPQQSARTQCSPADSTGFDQFDRNGDGVIDRAEYSAAVRAGEPIPRHTNSTRGTPTYSTGSTPAYNTGSTPAYNAGHKTLAYSTGYAPAHDMDHAPAGHAYSSLTVPVAAQSSPAANPGPNQPNLTAELTRTQEELSTATSQLARLEVILTSVVRKCEQANVIVPSGERDAEGLVGELCSRYERALDREQQDQNDVVQQLSCSMVRQREAELQRAMEAQLLETQQEMGSQMNETRERLSQNQHRLIEELKEQRAVNRCQNQRIQELEESNNTERLRMQRAKLVDQNEVQNSLTQLHSQLGECEGEMGRLESVREAADQRVSDAEAKSGLLLMQVQELQQRDRSEASQQQQQGAHEAIELGKEMYSQLEMKLQKVKQEMAAEQQLHRDALDRGQVIEMKLRSQVTQLSAECDTATKVSFGAQQQVAVTAAQKMASMIQTHREMAARITTLERQLHEHREQDATGSRTRERGAYASSLHHHEGRVSQLNSQLGECEGEMGQLQQSLAATQSELASTQQALEEALRQAESAQVMVRRFQEQLLLERKAGLAVHAHGMVTQATKQVDSGAVQQRKGESVEQNEMSSDVKQLRATVAMLKMEVAQDTHAARKMGGDYPQLPQLAQTRHELQGGTDWLSMLDGGAAGYGVGTEEQGRHGADASWRQKADSELSQAMMQQLGDNNSSSRTKLKDESYQDDAGVSNLPFNAGGLPIDVEEAREIAQQQQILESLERQAQALLGESTADYY